MKCSGCQTENPDQAKFCIECGSKLEFHCHGCGAVTPATGKFCMECGHNLKATEPQKSVNYDQPHSYTPKHLADKILTHRGAIEGERKLVTVLFADVANFTAMSEKLDPEEVHQIMDGCFKLLMDEIHRCEGTINQFTGDGVMALFGAPVAHEDHAQRACRAALAVQKALTGYGGKVKGQYDVPFQMRIGLNSGPVIVGAIGDDLRMDYTAVGDTTNMAARVEQHTEPGMVYLSRETRNITRDYFESQSVGEMAFKGKSEPQAIYRLISEYPHVRNRFEAGLVRGVTDLVGRKREIDELRTAFEKVKSGEAQIVDVVGEAGIGKSRLMYEFRESLGDESFFLTGLCMQYSSNINFLPVMDIVKTAFGIEQGMNEADAGRRIEEKATGSLAPMISFYRSLLSIKVDDPKFAALQPEGRKFGTFEAVKDLLIHLSREKPVVVFVEDVHWIDKISEEFFTFFSRCIAEHPIMLLSAYRPEGDPPWAQGMRYQRLGLETLSSKSSVHLVHNILGGLFMEPALEDRIVEKTKGNPFFVEEIVRELVERGDIEQQDDRYVSNRPINQLHIPNTVQAVLAARMDRLSEDLKHTMQVASVIGRDFAFKVLRTILELGEELRGHLTNLVGLEILYEKALFPELEYIFKHASFLNCLGYAYGEIQQAEVAWNFNMESDETAREFLEKYPEGRLQYAEIAAQARVNLMENLFELGKTDESWSLFKDFEAESRNEDYNMVRCVWETRMYYLASQILLEKGDLDQAENLISNNLAKIKRIGLQKREGSFLRLLGEVQTRRNELDHAIDSFGNAILRLEAVGNPRKIWESHAALASAYNKLGRDADAREHWGAAARVIEKQANGLLDLTMRESFLKAEPIEEILTRSDR